MNIIEALPWPHKDATKEAEICDAALLQAYPRTSPELLGFPAVVAPTTEPVEPASLDHVLRFAEETQSYAEAVPRQEDCEKSAPGPETVKVYFPSMSASSTDVSVVSGLKSPAKKLGEMYFLQKRNR